MTERSRVPIPQPPPSDGPHALHAPWRLSYLEMLGAEEREAQKNGTADADGDGQAGARPSDTPSAKPSCFLREYWLAPDADERNHVIVRTGTEQTGRGGLILLNAYPYSNGHLLVCLGRSRQRLLEYTPEERAELWSLVDLAVELCEDALPVHGVNVGINQGLAAGAGVPEHLHVHVVPRWSGDVNFITTIARIRVIPSALDEMAQRYREAWAKRRPGAGELCSAAAHPSEPSSTRGDQS